MNVMFLDTLGGWPEELLENVMLLRAFSKYTEFSGKITVVTRLLFNSMLIGILILFFFFFLSSFCKIHIGSGRRKISTRSSKQILESKKVSSSQICSNETLLCFTLAVEEMFTSSPVVGFVNDGHIKKTSLRKSGRPVNYRKDKGIQLLTKRTPL